MGGWPIRSLRGQAAEHVCGRQTDTGAGANKLFGVLEERQRDVEALIHTRPAWTSHTLLRTAMAACR